MNSRTKHVISGRDPVGRDRRWRGYEVNGGAVSVRLHHGGPQGAKPKGEVVTKILANIKRVTGMKKQTADPISEAAIRGDAERVRALLSQAKRKRKTLDAALGHVVKGGHVECAALLLKAGADPDSRAVSNSLLIEAAEDGDLEMVKLLIKAGADLHRNVAGADAFAAALEMDQTKVAEFLKSQGANWATTTLRYACEHGDLKHARQALDAGADVESRSPVLCDTPLTSAAGNGHAKVVRLLLERGANPNARVGGKTALFDAVHAGWYGETVLMAAAASGNLPIVKRLIELGAKVAGRDEDRGMSVMDHAKASKNKELIAYLNSLGAVADRDKPRALARALAREFGGKPVEHVAGFLLNARFHETVCQFNIGAEGFSLFVRGLDFGEPEFKRSKDGQILLSAAKPDFQRQKYEQLKGASCGVLVFRALGLSPLPAALVIKFCAKNQEHIQRMKLGKNEVVRLGGNFAGFYCPSVDISLAEQRLEVFARLIQGISRPPQPERGLFTSEWLLKPAPKSATSPCHQFGGKLEQPVACPHCGGATNLMAQLDLSDPVLPKTALGRGKLPVFWCLDCLEWEAAFFDITGPMPKPFNDGGKTAKSGKIKAGEDDLPTRQMTLVPVVAGKKAGRKSKLGGSPTWIQMEETPDCPKCEKPMAFVLQLASDSQLSYGDMGMLYAFACPDCRVTASLIQSHCLEVRLGPGARHHAQRRRGAD